MSECPPLKLTVCLFIATRYASKISTDMSAASGCFSDCENMFLTLQKHIWLSGASSGFVQTKLSAEENPEQ